MENRVKTAFSEQGFSLIEVIVALGLLAVVLMSVSGLFVQGGQTVNTGRDLTEATTLATDILEQTDKWAFSQLYTNFGVAKTSGAFSVDSLTNTQAQTWQPGITAKLPNSQATITVTPLGGATFDVAEGVRLQVTISWTLKLRSRSVSLETVRF
jgi:prepilin-type N-terminal cleavage/methylation domain-containing protein